MTFRHLKTNRFIVFSLYGLQSHVATNEHGISFSCNPILHTDGSALVFETIELAQANKTKFFDTISEVQCIAKVERMFPVHE